jgi:hypothetical protein
MEPGEDIERRARRVSDELVARGTVEMARRIAAATPPPPPGWHLVKSRRPDALDKDPEGTVARARGLYLRALGRDPADSTGGVAKLKEGAYIVAREAERRRLIRDTAATMAKWNAILEKKHGRLYETARNVWYGIPMTGAPELLYPELEDEDALTRGEWYDWARSHKEASAEAMIDHLASIIPANDGETYREWRERLKRRRDRWATETDEVMVNRTLYARPRPAGPRSPGKVRTGGTRKARKRRPR